MTVNMKMNEGRKNGDEEEDEVEDGYGDEDEV